MTMYFVAVSAAELERAKTDDEFAETLFEERDALDCDYLSISAAVEAMAEAEGSDETEPSFAEDGELPFEAGYGPAMFWTPKSLDKLESSTGWSIAEGLQPGLKKMLANAKKRSQCVLAMID